MEVVWWVVFLISISALTLLLTRVKLDIRWFSYGLLQLIVAAILLFLINGMGLLGEFYIPINAVTVAVIAILGLPGLGLIATVKLTLM